MTVVAVTFDGTRFNQVQDYTNWSNYGGSGAGGAVEPSLAYHNGQCAARQQSVTGGTLGGMQLNDGTTVDMTATDRDLWFFKVYVADAFDVNLTEGVRIGIGDGSSASSKSYNMAGSTALNDAYLAYPATGGYILGAIDPANTFWPIATAGTADLTVIDFFGCQASWINGNAKSLNLAMDAIDIGVGLYLVGGTGADPQASFVTYVEKDQDTTTNRWGCCTGAGNNVSAWCILRAGGAIEFTDLTSVVAFKDGYHGAGYTGVLHELDTAASTFDVGATMIGEGKLYNSGAIDTRPDYVVTGTTMTADYNFSANLRNFRNITFNSKVVSDGADIECLLLTQDTAEITNTTVRTAAPTNVACLQDPTFSATGLHAMTFEQSDVGHAVEVLATGSWSGIKFVGYGGTPGSNLTPASGAADAAVFNDTGGAVTITIVAGGDSPSVRNGTGATTTIVAAVEVTLTGMKDNTEVRVYDQSDPPVELHGIENAVAGTTDDRTFAFSLSATTVVDIAVFNKEWIMPPNNRFEDYVIPATDTDKAVSQVFDRNYENPA